ncbi:hypothetical protein DRO41_00885 [Candidatus Bathyarchaeota archaeon]|nr:MAG: hypothetical protein DRO41_00885 [Candidatus Bathyarchaeota archaeon]
MGRFKFLTYILTRAVSGVPIDSATLTKVGDLYWIWVEPDHYSYWERFERAYPYWEQMVRKYRVVPLSAAEVCWPTSSTRRGLVEWLSKVLGLTRGERKLLLLDVGL